VQFSEQFEQLADPLPETVPVGQSVHEALPPGENDPAVHS
jgi:hypothetical protein